MQRFDVINLGAEMENQRLCGRHLLSISPLTRPRDFLRPKRNRRLLRRLVCEQRPGYSYLASSGESIFSNVTTLIL